MFVGEVVDTSNRDRAAEVRVIDVWHGRNLPPEVVVIGGKLGYDVGSSGDREYIDGETYTFFVSEAEAGGLRDSACSPTAPVAEVARLDPPGIRAPIEGAAEPSDPRSGAPTWAAAGIVGSVVALVALRLGGRRGPRGVVPDRTRNRQD